MAETKDKLAHLTSTFSCPTHWETMTGNHRKRFCTDCKKHVYDFSQMTRGEIEAVLEATRGNLCARVTRQPDGSLKMQEVTAQPLHLISRRVSPLARAVVSAVLGFSPVLAVTAPPTPILIHQLQQTANSPKSTEGTTTSLSGTVVDAAGAVVPNVLVTITHTTSGEQQTTKSSTDGDYHFENISAGQYSLRAEMAGFLATVQEVTLLAGQQTNAQVTLQINGQSVTMGIIAMPVRPLRVLYEESEVIVDAIVGNSVVAKTKAGTDDDPKLLKTALHVNAYLKGERQQKVIYLYHWDYDREETAFKNGEELLLFLNVHKERQDGYELSDPNRSLKKLSARDLASYTSRIQELAALTHKRKPELAELLEWLVRCAQDPATRWEGAADLSDGFRALQWCEQEKKEKAEKAKTMAQQAVEALLNDLNEAPTGEPEITLQLATQLSAKQKEILTQTVLSIEKPSGDDFDLISLVAHWDKERLISYLYKKLQSLDVKTPSRVMWLTYKLADLIGNDELVQLAKDFNDDDLYADEYVQDLRLPQDMRNGLLIQAPLAPAKRRALLQKFLVLAESKLRPVSTK